MLAPAAFLSGAGATADHRIVYDATTGAHSFDQDSDGAIAAVRFATLHGAPPITEAECFGV